MSFHSWLLRRENGILQSSSDQDFIMRRVYKSMRPLYQWNDKYNKSSSNIGTVNVGGVFNLEFSPEGNLLVAACEKKSIVLFDVVSRQTSHKVMDAHTSNVNCIRFLDNQHFATCSDDTTVALWDLRFLKTKMRSLQGHSNWVKSIEYSKKDNLLVTSAFDGSIFTWDINSYTEQGLIYQKVFHTSGLMRCRLSPDNSKLILCTTGGYVMIIHDLDLTTLHKDLCGFRPIIYRLMQMGQQYIPQAAKFDHVFSKKQKKNRVELVTDFPEENDAEVILALEVHPKGHCFLSRNISYDGETEWLTVHDLEEESYDVTKTLSQKHNKDVNRRKRKRETYNTKDDEDEEEPNQTARGSRDTTEDVLININRRQRSSRMTSSPSNSTVMMPLRQYAATSSSGASGSSASGSSSAAGNNGNDNSTTPTFVPDIWAAEVTMQDRASRQYRERETNSTNVYNFVYAISSGVLPSAASNTESTAPTITSRNSGFRLLRGATVNINGNDGLPNYLDDVYISSDTSSSEDFSSRAQFPNEPRTLSPISITSGTSSRRGKHNNERYIFQNPKKLTYYAKELNTEKTFIKEPCFSSDGRIICSPFAKGVRLLGFSDSCSIYPHHQNYSSSSRIAKPLSELLTMTAHSDIVLSTRFSPREPLLVTGCRSGKIVWYQPNL